MIKKSLMEHSKTEYVTNYDDDKPNINEITLGCLQRIARALEDQNKIAVQTQVKDRQISLLTARVRRLEKFKEHIEGERYE